MVFESVKQFSSSDANVKKYVFKIPKGIVEAVLYKYGDFQKRTVVCCSVQSGCPVGCKFCGTGNNFLRNLTTLEIVSQVRYVFEKNNINTRKVEKLQIMFMSMGEPFLNYDNVESAIIELNNLYPNAQLLISTIAPKLPVVLNRFIELSRRIDKIGLQFSIHKSCDAQRDELIPFKKKLRLDEIRNYGLEWFLATGREPYCNYCIDGENNSFDDFLNLRNLFLPNVFNFTFSVVCSSDENMKEVSFRNLKIIEDFRLLFLKQGYNTRVFNPAGQDDIGGGCGQLWYVQRYLRKNGIKGRSLKKSNVCSNFLEGEVL